MTWRSNDPSVQRANWDWFNARNYCRKRCMDLVSIETQAEYEWLKERIAGKLEHKQKIKIICATKSRRTCSVDSLNEPTNSVSEIQD